MEFDDSGDFGRPIGGGPRRPLTQREIDTTGRRIRNIVGDPARDEFSDDEFNKWSERQVDRTTDINGNIVDKHIEPFKPEVTRQDLNLDGPVGDNADNARRDVFAAKKVMSRAGVFAFDPGDEPTVAVNPRFTKAIETFQAGNDLKIDGMIFPGGPTVHALGFKAIGQENGRPSGFDAADFKQSTGRDGNRRQSGAPIFAETGALDTNTTLPAVGEGSASFGGPLQLGSTKSESGVGGEVARKAVAQPLRPPITHRQAETESVRKLEKIVGPIFPPALEELGKEAAVAAAKAGSISQDTMQKLKRVWSQGRAWEKAQAALYLRQVMAVNPDLIATIGAQSASRGDLVTAEALGRLSNLAARLDDYPFAKRWFKVERVDRAKVLWAIQNLDNLRGLSNEQKTQLRGFIATRVGAKNIRALLQNTYFQINRKKHNPPPDAAALIKALEKLDGGLFDQWVAATSLMLGLSAEGANRLQSGLRRGAFRAARELNASSAKKLAKRSVAVGKAGKASGTLAVGAALVALFNQYMTKPSFRRRLERMETNTATKTSLALLGILAAYQKVQKKTK